MATFFLLRFSRNNSIYALNKTSIVAKAIADNDKYMERKHVKPVIEFVLRRWKYHKPGLLNASISPMEPKPQSIA